MNTTENKYGCFIISLDFEMMWGNFNKWTRTGYDKSNVANVRDVITRTIQLFDKYGIHATFATVGLIAMSGKEEALRNFPDLQPSYTNDYLSPYKHIPHITDESLYFGPDIISQIYNNDKFEIGSHTFCHYFCLEKGQTIEQFNADISRSIEVFHSKNITLNSIVFPRNHIDNRYLKVCSSLGFNAFRGNAKKFYTFPKNKLYRYRNKILRVLDSYLNIDSDTTYKLSSMEIIDGMLNVRSSRILKPYNRKLSFLENLKLRRIKKEMLYAAKHNEVYHLWWHPHNHGANIDENMNELESLLKHFKECQKLYGMKSCNINEIANLYFNRVTH